MILISEITIKSFRSIYELKLEKVEHSVTVVTGKNDVGKSNVLRALNLFFNGKTNADESFLFGRDFSQVRKMEIKTQKRRQQIEISIKFKAPQGYKSLPRFFWGTRRWYKDSAISIPDISWAGEVGKKSNLTRMASRFLNSIEYTYIPAIKDGYTFTHVLNKLKANLPELNNSSEIRNFNETLSSYGEELKKDLMDHVNLTPSISLPATLQELLTSLDFLIEDSYKIVTPLSRRGDGIRCRFIPAIMNYIGLSSSKKHIWGLEEPENSLEFSKAQELNNTIEHEYSKNAQIFISSHSPAFVGSLNEHSKKNIYLISKNEHCKVNSLRITKDTFDEHDLTISSELGYIKLQKALSDTLNRSLEESDRQKNIYEKLTKQAKNNIIFVEGESDIKIITNAWNKLKEGVAMNFSFQICGGHNTIHATLNSSECCNKTSKHKWLGLFDFDDAFNGWNGLKKNWEMKEDDITKGLLKKSDKCEKYAMLIPVPTFRSDYATLKWGGTSKLSIELLFTDDILKGYLHKESDPAEKMIFNRRQKIYFSEESRNFQKEAFVNFIPLIDSLEGIFI